MKRTDKIKLLLTFAPDKEISDARHEVIDEQTTPLRTLVRDLQDVSESAPNREERSLASREFSRLKSSVRKLFYQPERRS